MLWRLNFSVILLMWTHNNTYILYYICPMHTFYFFMVYITMYIYSSINHSKYGIRIKLLVVGIVIFLVWDVNYGLFDIIFASLGMCILYIYILYYILLCVIINIIILYILYYYVCVYIVYCILYMYCLCICILMLYML